MMRNKLNLKKGAHNTNKKCKKSEYIIHMVEWILQESRKTDNFRKIMNF